MSAGITWVLSEEVVNMDEVTWRARLDELARLIRRTGNTVVDVSEPALRPLHDWLEHQKALLALGAHRPAVMYLWAND